MCPQSLLFNTTNVLWTALPSNPLKRFRTWGPPSSLLMGYMQDVPMCKLTWLMSMHYKLCSGGVDKEKHRHVPSENISPQPVPTRKPCFMGFQWQMERRVLPCFSPRASWLRYVPRKPQTKGQCSLPTRKDSNLHCSDFGSVLCV